MGRLPWPRLDGAYTELCTRGIGIIAITITVEIVTTIAGFVGLPEGLGPMKMECHVETNPCEAPVALRSPTEHGGLIQNGFQANGSWEVL